MEWLRRLFTKQRAERRCATPEQILSSLIGSRTVPIDQCPKELIKEGWTSRHKGQPEIAHDLFVSAAALAHSLGDNRSFGRALIALADNVLHFYPADADVFEIREILAAHAKEILSAVRDLQGVATALRVQATIAPSAAARQMLEESLRICEETGDADGVASSLESLGSHLALFGDKVEATAFKRKALEMARVLGKQERIADCLFSLAIGFDGDQNEQLQILEEAQSIFEKVGQQDSQARCLTLCAHLTCDDEAVKVYLERAACAARQGGNLFLRGICLDNLIKHYRDQGDLSKVVELEQERKQFPNIDFSVEDSEELEQAFSTSDPETMVSAVRKWFSGGIWKKR